MSASCRSGVARGAADLLGRRARRRIHQSHPASGRCLADGAVPWPVTMRCRTRCHASVAGPETTRGSDAVGPSRPVQVAFFDMDNTVIRSNIVKPYVVLRTAELSPPDVAWFVPVMLLRVLLYLALDSYSRTLFNQVFYRLYQGRDASNEAKERDAGIVFERYYRPNVLPQAQARIRELQDAGARVVLVTGALDFMVRPVAAALGVDHVIATVLEEEDGRFTGGIVASPVADEEKARRMRAWAEKEGVDLARCHAYGDSYGDLSMLELVGEAFTVSPDARLRRIAEERGWGVLPWRD